MTVVATAMGGRWRTALNSNSRTAMKKLRIVNIRVLARRDRKGSLNDGRIQNPSSPFGIVPLSNVVPRGFGIVHQFNSHSLSRSAKPLSHDSQLFHRSVAADEDAASPVSHPPLPPIAISDQISLVLPLRFDPNEFPRAFALLGAPAQTARSSVGCSPSESLTLRYSQLVHRCTAAQS
jgi:hypothetical protein